MAGETNLNVLIKSMKPILNPGAYIFATVKSLKNIERHDTLFEFQEKEGTTIVMKKQVADHLGIQYDYVASWITLDVHSSLEAVGLTAKFSTMLANHGLSCNVVSGYYHDHIFVSADDADQAMKVLVAMTKDF